MEDSVSVKSMESVATSDEYEFVNDKGTSKKSVLEAPMLKIANNGNLEDLQNNLREVHRTIINYQFYNKLINVLNIYIKVLTEDTTKMENVDNVKIIVADQKTKTVGRSKFYDVSSSEKQDQMKPEDYEDDGKLKKKKTNKIILNKL